MEPANRRRRAAGSVVVAMIAAVVVSVLLTRSSTHSGHTARSRTPSPGAAPAPKFRVSERDTYKLVDGMTGNQVRHLLGEPTAKRGRCWVYRTTPDPRLAAQRVVETDVSACFYGGQLSDTSSTFYVRLRGKRVPLPTSTPTSG